MLVNYVLAVAAILGSLSGVSAFVNSLNQKKIAKGQAEHTRQQLATKVDEQAYEVARGLYDDILRRAQEDRDYLRGQLAEAQLHLQATERELALTRREMTEERKFLQHQQSELQREINRLKQILQEVGIPVDDDRRENAD